MRVVAIVFEREVLEAVVEERFRPPADHEPGQRKWLTRELLVGLLDVIQVQVAIAAGPDEFSDRKSVV